LKKKLIAILSASALILIAVAYWALDRETRVINAAERSALGGTYVALSDGVTHYKLEGPLEGPVTVLVHGGTLPHWTWDQQVPALTQAGFRVLRYDHYGRGYSDRPDLIYNQELYQRQLLELLNRLSIKEPVDLIGVSLGGGIAINFTALHPDRVNRLILIAPVIKDYRSPAVLRYPIIGELIAHTVGIRIVEKRLLSLFGDHPDAEKYRQLFSQQVSYRGFRKSLLSLLRHNALGDYTKAYDTVGRQERRCLLIWGTADQEITREMVNAIRSRMPNLTFEAVESSDHGIIFKEPELINQLIVDFLTRDRQVRVQE
jgi:pimeloyl-ACP methyl ester carboxylesterase